MHIRVVSPSSSIEHIGGFEANLAAKERLEKLGFIVSFSEHYLENDILGSAPSKAGWQTSMLPFRMTPLMLFWPLSAVSTAMNSCPIWTLSWLLEILRFSAATQTQQPCSTLSIARLAWKPTWDRHTLALRWMPCRTIRQRAGSRLSAKLLMSWPLVKNGATMLGICLMPHWLPETEWKVYHHGQAQATVIGGNLSTFSLLRGTPLCTDRWKLCPLCWRGGGRWLCGVWPQF